MWHSHQIEAPVKRSSKWVLCALPLVRFSQGHTDRFYKGSIIAIVTETHTFGNPASDQHGFVNTRHSIEFQETKYLIKRRFLVGIVFRE